MDFSQHFTKGFKNRNKAHFTAIVHLAMADGYISKEEKAFIDRLAIYLEIDPEMVNQVMESPDQYKTDPPADRNTRLERLYDLSKMIYADNIADENEKQLLEKMVIGLGFEAETANRVVNTSLEMVSKGIDQDDFIETFKI
tara:strand:+ start:380 stop:802 length:423 start_codon:yes stop_codon:yes gene_type:complete